jgi:hypothetical protein
MSELRKKQVKFTRMIALLISWVYEHEGWEVTFCPEHEKHMKNSLHYSGLAKDLNLFINGRFMETTEAHRPMGEFWESIGGSWGGRFKDGNHYSLEHAGVR